MMETYTQYSMVTKENAKWISNKLNELGSKVQQHVEADLDDEADNKIALANLLYLACGASAYRLSKEQILQIKNDKFRIETKAIDFMLIHPYRCED